MRERISMCKSREILRHILDLKLPYQVAEQSLGVSHGLVCRTLAKVRERGMTWPDLASRIISPAQRRLLKLQRDQRVAVHHSYLVEPLHHAQQRCSAHSGQSVPKKSTRWTNHSLRVAKKVIPQR